MSSPPPRPLLARLRSSARLVVLVLLVFVLKIGAAAACANHDFTDAGLGTKTASSQGPVLEAVSTAEAGMVGMAGILGHASTCNLCSCQHAAVVVPTTHLTHAITPDGLAVRTAGLPSSVSSPLEIRPPIA